MPPTIRRSRPVAVLAAAGGSAAALLAVGRSWAAGSVQGPTGPAGVSVGGRESAPAVIALALVAAAATIALLTAGRRTRPALGVLLLLAGAGTLLLAARAGADPAGQLPAAAARATGVSQPLVTGAHATPWPWLGAAAGLAMAGGGLVALLRGSGWPAPSRRYVDRPGPAGGPGDGRGVGGGAQGPGLRDWDALSRGEDPTA